MKKTHILFLTIILTFVGYISGILTGVAITLRNVKQDDNDNQKEIVITSTTIVEKLQQRSFLVTNSIITSQESTTKVENGSAWSNFWWGKQVNAKAMVQVDLGIDLTKVKKEDIRVDNTKKTINIRLPKAEVYNSSVMGDIEVRTSQGVLQKLLANNPNGDYNEAKARLTEDAQKAVEANAEYLNGAEAGAADTIKIMLDQFGYEVSFEVE